MTLAHDSKRNALANMDMLLAYRTGDAHSAKLFDKAMAEADVWHRAKNPAYAAMWEGDERPIVPVSLFKQMDLNTTIAGPGVWLTSSGSGQSGAVRVFYDAASMARVEKGMTAIFMHNGLLTENPSRFLLFSPDPRKAQHAGYATAFLKFTGCAPVADIVFCCNEQGQFLPDRAWDALSQWATSAEPIFIFGLTVFFEQLYLSGRAAIEFKGSIRALTGGGWKGLTKRMERSEAIAGLAKLLDAPELDIRDIYGMTEHPLHYVSCRHGNFHIPVYSRFSIMDARGLPAPAGEPGIIRLQNPFFASLPGQDLLTEDRGLWGEGCPCGDDSPYVHYLGRLGGSGGTCAHEAAGRM